MQTKLYTMKINSLLLKVFILTLILIGQATNTKAQRAELRTNVVVPNGEVSAVAIHPSKKVVYIAGSFTGFSNRRPYGAKVNHPDSSEDFNFPLPDGEVKTAISDKQGGWFIGGFFNKFGDSSRAGIVHIDSTGFVTDHFSDLSLDSVCSLYLYGDTLFIGGALRHPINGDFVLYSLRNKGIMSWPMNVKGRVDAIHYLIGGAQLILTGQISEVNNMKRYGLVSINMGQSYPNGWAPNTLNAVCVVDTNRLYVFRPETYYCYIPAIETLVWEFNTHQYSKKPTTAVIMGDAIVIGGKYTNIYLYSEGLAFIEVVNRKSGGYLPSDLLRAKFTARSIEKMVWDGQRLLIAGDITSYNNVACSNLLQVNFTTSGDTIIKPWNITPNDVVDNIIITDAGIYVAGMFSCVSYPIKKQYLAAVDLHTGLLTNWSPGSTNGVINSMVATENAVIVGGNFNSVNGIYRRNVAVFHPVSGALLGDFLSASAEVKQFLKVGDNIFMSGKFQSVNGIGSQYLAKILPDFTVDASILVNGEISIMYSRANHLLLGGNFTSVMGNERFYIADININTNGLSRWGSNWLGFGKGPVHMIYGEYDSSNMRFISGFYDGQKRVYGHIGFIDTFDIVRLTNEPEFWTMPKECAVAPFDSGNFLGWNNFGAKYPTSALSCTSDFLSLSHSVSGLSTRSVQYWDGFLVAGGNISAYKGGQHNLLVFTIGTPVDPKLSIGGKKLLFDSLGGAQQLKVYADAYWVATKNASWLTISKGSGLGNDSIMVLADPNPTGNTRYAQILFQAGNTRCAVTVTQLSGSADLMLSEDTLYFKSGKETQTLSLISNTSWTNNVNNNWAALDFASGSGSRGLQVTVQVNTDSVPRMQVITFSTTGIQKQVVLVQDTGKISSGVVKIAAANLLNPIIYPNPANNICVLDDLPINERLQIQVINGSGLTVLPPAEIKGVSSYEFSISMLNAGVYFVCIKSDSAVKTLKLVKIE